VLRETVADGQEDLEILHPGQGSYRSLQHGLLTDLNVLVHVELQIGGQVDVVQHRVPGVASGRTLTREGRSIVVVLLVGGIPQC